MHHLNYYLTKLNFYSVQPAEPPPPPEFPNEMLQMVFSFLSYKDLTASCVSNRWRDASLAIVTRKVNKTTKCFIDQIINYLEENKENQVKIKDLKLKIDFSNDHFLELRDRALLTKQNLISLLKELSIEEQRALKTLFANEKMPLHFHDTFNFVPPNNNEAMQAIALGIFGNHNIHRAIAHYVQDDNRGQAMQAIAQVFDRNQNLPPRAVHFLQGVLNY